MASVSSLLKSAAARQAKVQEQQDAQVAFEYSQSAKTYQDFLSYSQYIDGQAAKTSDPSKALSYAKTTNAARNGYVSNEIQRQSIAVVEGRQSNTDKYSKMANLFYQAIDNGNYDLAQSLNLQLDNLSVTIQNEHEAAQKAASTLALNGVKTLEAFVKKVKEGDQPIELADGTLIKPLSMLGDETKAAGTSQGGDYFYEALRTVKVLQETIAAAYQGASSQDAVDAIESKFGDILNGDYKFATAAGNLSAKDIELAYRSGLANNPIYSPQASRDETTGALTYKLAKNKVDDFTWIRNDDGTYQAVETRAKVESRYQTLDSKITNEGYFIDPTTKNISAGQATLKETNDSQSIKNRLAAQGIEATSGDNGKINLVLPDGRTYEGTIQPDGSIRYFGDPGQFSGGQAGLYQIDLLDGGVREISPDESSIFGTNSVFGGQISKASDAGKNIALSLAGVVKNSNELFGQRTTISNVANDFTGRGTPVGAANLQGTTNLLDNASQTRAAIIKSQDDLARLQPAAAFNLNQTPVQQYAQNGAPIKQLSVAPPVKAPSVSVAAPQPATPISSVNVAQNVPRVTGVVPLPAQPKVTVR